MTYDVSTVNDYIVQLSENRKSAIKKLGKTILDNLPESFEEGVTYKMKATIPCIPFTQKGTIATLKHLFFL